MWGKAFSRPEKIRSFRRDCRMRRTRKFAGIVKNLLTNLFKMVMFT